MKTFFIILNILGGLAVFLYGMKLMSDGMQKIAGNSMRKLLATAPKNRVTATLTGIIVTSIIQSSSATTVMVVGFSSAGILSLTQAMGVIFGANIGTTVTVWIISFFGFKLQLSLFLLPVIAAGFFILYAVKWKTLHRLGEVMVGFGFMFLGLYIIQITVPDFTQAPQVAQWFAQLRPDTLGSLLLLISIGTALTAVLESSTAVIALTITLAAKGFFDFPTAAALVLGENIGTTITANLSAIGSSRTAKRAALAHFLFNFLGVVWVICIFKYFVDFVNWVMPGSPYGTDNKTLMLYIPFHISAFHTIFNVFNTVIMLFFIKPLGRLTTIIIPHSKREEKPAGLVFIDPRFTVAPELAVEAARKEIERMAASVSKIISKLIHALKVDDDAMFEQLIKDVYTLEESTDILEYKINTYLVKLLHERISTEVLDETMALIDIINTIERMGDGGQKIAKIIEITRKDKEFSQTDKDNIEEIALKVKQAVKDAREGLLRTESVKSSVSKEALRKAFEREMEINDLRHRLRDERNLRMKQDSSITPISSTHYSDILSRFERMADHALRIIEASASGKTPEQERADMGGEFKKYK
ncbi:Na+/phosphate symporter [Elusimicrobium minutum Pei191]|uniref:Na+/phosphate symporter n=1 Tax=Elusimicrobium minutum (strain Pei191) TaxID=445932 RepID=B2KBL1_ELUMP|nr:Na/Pi cotransporter family protein [Elusimicrobium minutum]ACC98033.1 Na+/phosphate symporter [Elusimicrobium minutum Pei191]